MRDKMLLDGVQSVVPRSKGLPAARWYLRQPVVVCKPWMRDPLPALFG